MIKIEDFKHLLYISIYIYIYNKEWLCGPLLIWSISIYTVETHRGSFDRWIVGPPKDLLKQITSTYIILNLANLNLIVDTIFEFIPYYFSPQYITLEIYHIPNQLYLAGYISNITFEFSLFISNPNLYNKLGQCVFTHIFFKVF